MEANNIKEEFKMNGKYVKYAIVGVAGYLMGFYEMKYKAVKAIAMGKLTTNKNESDKDVCDEEES